MSVRIVAPNLVWHPHPSEDSQRALRAALAAWEGTPYQSGQRFRGRGADCVGAVFGVIDDLDGLARAQAPGLPTDASLHNTAAAVIAVRELVRRYSPCRKVEGLDVRPGHILVTGQGAGGPGHVAIVGARRNEIWQATPGAGFHQGGWGMLSSQVLFAVYELGNDGNWRFPR